MTSDSFPSRELLEVIKGQARVEEKIDSILRMHTSTQEDVKSLDGRVKKLETRSTWEKGYVAAAGSVGGASLAFFLSYLKSKLGL